MLDYKSVNKDWGRVPPELKAKIAQVAPKTTPRKRGRLAKSYIRAKQPFSEEC